MTHHRPLNVLIACESSGEVRRAFRDLGHNAWSCDLLPADDGSRYHVTGDALETVRGQGYHLRGAPRTWDLLIAHPPCTRICNSGVHWLARRNLWGAMELGAQFFKAMLDAPVARICVENPVPHKYAVAIIGRKYDQTIQPYEFGEPESKRTCLWLKGLPKLVPTEILRKERQPGGHWRNQTPSGQNKLGPSPTRWKERSKTYTGIAQAMAHQWGGDARGADEVVV